MANKRLIKSRLKAIDAALVKWRKRLKIDQKWQIDVATSDKPYIDEYTNKPDTNAMIVFDDDRAEYWYITLMCYPALMDLPAEEFKEQIDCTIRHELFHLIQWQSKSFALNMLGPQCKKELEKLEEQVVQQLEDITEGVKWPIT